MQDSRLRGELLAGSGGLLCGCGVHLDHGADVVYSRICLFKRLRLRGGGFGYLAYERRGLLRFLRNVLDRLGGVMRDLNAICNSLKRAACVTPQALESLTVFSAEDLSKALWYFWAANLA